MKHFAVKVAVISIAVKSICVENNIEKSADNKD